MGGADRSAIGVLPRVLAAQMSALVLILIVAWMLSALFATTARPPAWALALGQGAAAAGLSRAFGLGGGWLIAQFILPQLAWLGLGLGRLGLGIDVPAWLFLLAFAVLFLMFRNTSKERVPLYLTNRTTWAALSELLDEENRAAEAETPPQARPRFVDLGCGLGGAIAYLSKHHPDWDFVGVENAPGPYVLSKLRLLGRGNAQVRFENIWDTDLSRFDVVYAFLSPAPMPRLIARGAASMKPGTLLISNSFWAPDLPFDGEARVNDGRKTRLFFKRMM